MVPERKIKKGKKAKRKEPSIIRMCVLITGIYFVILLGVVYCVRSLDVELLETGKDLPAQWLMLLYFTYYLLPFLLASIFGVAFKPFWRGFRNVLVSIFVIHFLYSFAVYSVRHEHKIKWYKVTHQDERGLFKIISFDSKLMDDDKDGRLDRVELNAIFNVENLPSGEYFVDLLISQNGKPLPDANFETYRFRISRAQVELKSTVVEEKRQQTAQGYTESFTYVTKGLPNPDNQLDLKIIKQKFNLPIDRVDQHFNRGPVDIDLKVRRVINIGPDAEKIISLNRWAAFLRTTSWEGYDSEIRPTKKELDKFLRVETVHVIPLTFKRKQVFFREYIGDFPEDLDGDGLYDRVIVSMKIHSNYIGPIYFEGEIEGMKTVKVSGQAELHRGLNKVDFILPADVIRSLGFNGPYEIIRFRFSNDDPECYGEACAKKLKASFVEYLDNYITEMYTLEQFE